MILSYQYHRSDMRPGIGTVIVDPELSLALAVSYGALSVRAGAATVGVETSRTQHRHRAYLSQAVETSAISTKQCNRPKVTQGRLNLIRIGGYL